MYSYMLSYMYFLLDQLGNTEEHRKAITDEINLLIVK